MGLMLGYDIDAALPELRRQAESMMVDSCAITIPSDQPPAWDAESGEYVPAPPVVLYAGKCRVKQPLGTERDVNAGQAEWTVTDRVVSIPLEGDGYTAESATGIPLGANVTMTAIGPATDPYVLGKDFTYTAPMSEQTHTTARRMRCKEVQAG